MKWLVSFAMLFSMSAWGATVINYDDGSTYTLTDNQDIYVSTPSSVLFKRQVMSNEDTFSVLKSLGLPVIMWKSR